MNKETLCYYPAPGKVGWESSRTVFLRHLCSIEKCVLIISSEYALFQRTIDFFRVWIFLWLCSFVCLFVFLVIFIGLCLWSNCLWNFKPLTGVYPKLNILVGYRLRPCYTVCAVQPSFISFSRMKCLQQFPRVKDSSLRYKWIQYNMNKANTSDTVRSCQNEWRSRTYYLHAFN